MKLIVFGTQKEYLDDIGRIKSVCDVVCLSDNDSSKWNTFFNGIKILPPPMLRLLEYDRVLIIENQYNKIAEQLVLLGIPKEKIWNSMIFNTYMQRGNVKIYGGIQNVSIKPKKKILIIAYALRYDGSTMAAVHAMEALKSRGYMVVLASFSGDEKFVRQQSKNGNIILIAPSLLYPHEEELAWVSLFDEVIVNTYVMIASAAQINLIKPVVWWLHEVNEIYSLPNYKFLGGRFEKSLKEIPIYAVSNIAKDNFNRNYPYNEVGIMPYGISDENGDFKLTDYKNKRLVFAIVGNVTKIKAQNVFVKAAKLINMDFEDNAEFWIIGRCDDGKMYENFCKEIAGVDNIKLCGEMTHDEMNRAYQNDIDVVVCASWEETMSLVVTEAMMYAKPCITTNTTGMADYVEDRVNGLICKAGDANDLKDKMEWMISNKDKLGKLGQNARKTYEEYFTMDKFADRLENALNKAAVDFDIRSDEKI